MKKIFVFFFFFLPVFIYGAEFKFGLKNWAYAYNAENDSDWEKTRTTMTYFEDVFQPTATLVLNSNVSLTFGVGFYVPFNQEEKLLNYYPVVSTVLDFDAVRVTLGTLDPDHDLPAPILDPLAKMTPQIRVISESQVPIDYEAYPVTGLFSHGMYEYGLAVNWDVIGTGELYMNWQLPDTTNHRERFDVGLAHRFEFPLYTAVHYWHNGGHEHPHPVTITENYVAAAGIRTDKLNALYLASYFLPDRDVHPELNTFGQGLYFSYQFDLLKWTLQPELFVSSEFLWTNQQYISIEGDPFYRVPFYAGLNISRRWQLHEAFEVEVAFVNGIYIADRDHPGNVGVRYDQKLWTYLDYRFGE